MKKVILISLLGVLLLSLTGCKSWDYEKAQKSMDSGDYAKAIELYDKMKDYESSSDKLKECYENYIEELELTNSYEKATEYCNKYSTSLGVNTSGMKQSIEVQSIVWDILNGRVETGWQELRDYKLPADDTSTTICTDVINNLLKNSNKDTRAVTYELALHLNSVAPEHEKTAVADFITQLETDYPKLKLTVLEIGDTFVLGKYPKTVDVNASVLEAGTVASEEHATTEQIEWLVLDKRGTKVFALAKQPIEVLNIKNGYKQTGLEVIEPVSGVEAWKYSFIRRKLNTDMYNTFFDDSDKAKIVDTIIDDCAEADKLFLLSYNDVVRYKDSADLRTKATDYSLLHKSNGGLTVDQFNAEKEVNAIWALRRTAADPVTDAEDAGWFTDGYTFYQLQDSWGYVRPAMWIEITYSE